MSANDFRHVTDRLEQAGERYAALPTAPLRVTARLAAPAISYDGLHLDGILAYAVLEELTHGMLVPQSGEYLRVPLPLRAAWWSASGVPLWRSTDLLPDAPAVADVVYLHRRALEPAMTRRNIQTGKGRHKEKRTPLPAVNNTVLVADVDGNADEIARLLATVSSIGKKRIVAGRVLEWTVEEIDAFSFFDATGRARRPVPLDYLGEPDSQAGAELAFSPPYWHRATRAWCVPTGGAP